MKKILIFLLLTFTFVSAYSCPNSNIHNNAEKIIKNKTVEIYNGRVYFDEIIWESMDAKAKNTWTKVLYIYIENHYKWEVDAGLYGNRSGKKIAEYKYGKVEIY